MFKLKGWLKILNRYVSIVIQLKNIFLDYISQVALLHNIIHFRLHALCNYCTLCTKGKYGQMHNL